MVSGFSMTGETADEGVEGAEVWEEGERRGEEGMWVEGVEGEKGMPPKEVPMRLWPTPRSSPRSAEAAVIGLVRWVWIF